MHELLVKAEKIILQTHLRPSISPATSLREGLMRALRTLLVICAIAALAGCAGINRYKESYRPLPGMSQGEIEAMRLGPPAAIPSVERGPSSVDRETLPLAYQRRGLQLIGISDFNSGNSEEEKDAVSQAQAVGADVVLILAPKYSGTVTGTHAVTTPTTTTSHTKASTTTKATGTSSNTVVPTTTTTYGTQTTYVPYSIDRQDHTALFFVRTRMRLGAFWRGLSDAERQQLQSNRGVVVTNLVDGSPAFEADVLPGDVIVELDGRAVGSPQELTWAIQGRRPGEFVTLTIVRSGARITKRVEIR